MHKYFFLFFNEIKGAIGNCLQKHFCYARWKSLHIPIAIIKLSKARHRTKKCSSNQNARFERFNCLSYLPVIVCICTPLRTLFIQTGYIIAQQPPLSSLSQYFARPRLVNTPESDNQLIEENNVHELCSDWHPPYTVFFAPYSLSRGNPLKFSEDWNWEPLL